jgi:thioredoxin-dependent peroxiredoxin
MLAVGQIAPEFTGTAADGSRFSLASTRGRPLVLYFYPRANSRGCSIEARGFAEHYPEFQASGTGVVGISVDDVAAEKRFVDECHLPFPIVSDVEKAISRQYGVLSVLGFARRVTFFLDADGRVAEVVEGLNPGPHVQAAVRRNGTAAAR